MAALVKPKDISRLLKAIDVYEGDFKTKCALRLLPLCMVRTGELRHATWENVDFDTKVMCGHGFRSMASTRLNEMGFRYDVIEKQLAHEEKNSVRKAYNRAEYLNERRAMLQEWADYLDGLCQKAGQESKDT